MVKLTDKEIIERACEMRGISVRKACGLTKNVSYKTLYTRFSRGGDMKFNELDELSHVLDLPLAMFSRYTPQVEFKARDSDKLANLAAEFMEEAVRQAQLEALRNQQNISTTDVMNWLSRHNHRLEDFDALRESADLFKPMTPEDNVPTPYRLGRKSLAVEFFELREEDQYARTVGSFGKDVLAGIKMSRLEAAEKPFVVDHVNIEVLVGNKLVRERYRRLIANVDIPNGEQLTLVHSELIPKIHVPDHEVTDRDLIQRPESPVSDPEE